MCKPITITQSYVVVFCGKEFIHLPLWKVLQVGHLEHGLISRSHLGSTWSPLLIYQEELIVSNTDRNLKWNFQISKYSGITNNGRRGWLSPLSLGVKGHASVSPISSFIVSTIVPLFQTFHCFTCFLSPS